MHNHEIDELKIEDVKSVLDNMELMLNLNTETSFFISKIKTFHDDLNYYYTEWLENNKITNSGKLTIIDIIDKIKTLYSVRFTNPEEPKNDDTETVEKTESETQ